MYKEFSGFCNIANTERSIDINYLTASSVDSGVIITKKSKYTRCSGCTSQSCPLFENAPKQI